MRPINRSPQVSGRNRRRWMFGVATVALVLSLALTRSSTATIQNSAHDFSSLDPNQQLCIFCHTTHGADTSVNDAPLWNHEVTQKQYTLYNSPTMDATTSQPQGVSRLCLSCHDGTVAVDSYGGQSGAIFLSGPVAIGADELNNDHPIAFIYDDVLAQTDGELHPPSSTDSGLGSTIANDLLFNGSLECGSCHDVHNGPAAAAVNDHLLMISRVQSQLCLTCHNK